ncbi:PREDICTED: heparan-alpha-glucosaminide N-acetyltransferase-like [Populus euphratica]|uniref:Heparan-alpha-glucosaminide N-acetyltransferase-like n=1 Tax=Populus euphratica TaxID=75702 RepID=A0AAJ6U0A0_POPEU|nr:PREDICTED: heparan-alpha-glucosaminide N-acetyltransferase-like [Populus euphratica]
MAMAMTMAMYKPIKGQEEEDNGNGNKSLESNDEDGVGGDHTIVDDSKSFILPTHSKQQHHQQRLKQQQQQRLVSLDVFRGLTVALMILVDDAGGVLPAINHSPWNGLTLADVVMPFFLFMVGVSLGLTYKKLPSKAVATRKAILRALKLLLIGLFLQGGFLHGLNDLTFGVDMVQIRWMGILQRIAIGYLIGAMCEIWLKGDNHVASGLSMLRKYQLQWGVVVVLVSLYLSLLYGLYVPDWEYQIPVAASSSSPKIFRVKCGVRGTTGSACNAVGMIDRTVLGIQHLYRKPIYARTKACSINSPDYGPLPPEAPSWCQAPFDPEGLLSSVMAIVTCLVGLHYGHIIVHFKEHKDRILHWMVPSTCFVVLGLVLDLSGMHVNKALYTFSYMCVTAGAAGIVFTGIYMLVDVCGFRRPTLVLEWMGMHALMIFILATSNVLPVVLQGFYWKQPGNNILRLIGIGR